jgi:PAS domain S-box-containing protein
VKDTASRLLVANEAVVRFMGRSTPEELIGKTDHNFYEKELADEYRSDELKVITSGRPLINKDEPKMGPDNKMAWVTTTKVPFRDSQGRIIGIVGISRNITERKQAENACNRLNRELALKNKELESILYAASHDLRTPLVNIQGFSDELSRNCNILRTAFEKKEPVTSAEKKQVDSVLHQAIPEALGYISTSAKKIDSLISGLLRLSRLGREVMKIEPLDMNLMVSEIKKSMEYQIKEADTKLIIEHLPPCIGDASQINQVFSNLLDNAVKYLDKSRPGIIQVRGRTAGEHSIYCIEDNGAGIAPDHQEKIFEIFHRLQPANTEGGEGLGLTIVRRILDKHKGSVWVKSELGKGSRFFVSLPTS